jgi:hypothetical protein
MFLKAVNEKTGRLIEEASYWWLIECFKRNPLILNKERNAELV